MIAENADREKYASMHDSELLSFANHEGHLLSSTVLDLLKAEFINRKLDIVVFENLSSNNKNLTEPDSIPEKFRSSDIAYAFDLKEEMRNDDEILSALQETGLEQAIAQDLVDRLRVMAKQQLKNAEIVRLTGSLVFISGIAVRLLPLPFDANKLIYIFAWCAILFGMGRLIKGIFNVSRFKKILHNILLEK